MKKRNPKPRTRPAPHGPAPSVMSMRAGPGPTVAERGKTWKLGWNNQDAKAHLESVILANATRKAVKQMDDTGGVAGARVFREFQLVVDDGAYSTFGPSWIRTMAGADASWLFLLSLLLEHQPGAQPEDAIRLLKTHPREVGVAVGVIAPDFFLAVVTQVGVDEQATPEQVAQAVATLAAAVMDKFREKERATPDATPAPATG